MSHALIFSPTGTVEECGPGFIEAQHYEVGTIIYCKYWSEPWCICAEYSFPRREKDWEAMELENVPKKHRAYALVLT